MIIFEFSFVFNRMIFNLNNLDRDVTDFQTCRERTQTLSEIKLKLNFWVLLNSKKLSLNGAQNQIKWTPLNSIFPLKIPFVFPLFPTFFSKLSLPLFRSEVRYVHRRYWPLFVIAKKKISGTQKSERKLNSFFLSSSAAETQRQWVVRNSNSKVWSNGKSARGKRCHVQPVLYRLIVFPFYVVSAATPRWRRRLS